jgi:hypothetical protein
LPGRAKKEAEIDFAQVQPAMQGIELAQQIMQWDTMYEQLQSSPISWSLRGPCHEANCLGHWVNKQRSDFYKEIMG